MSRMTLNHDPWDIIAGTLAVLCLFDTCNTNTSGKACVSLETLNHVPWHTIAGAVPVFCLLATLKVRQEAKYASERCHFLQEMLRMALPSHCMYTTWERRARGLPEGADHAVALQFLDRFGLPAKRPRRTMSATSGHAYCKILPPLMHTRRQAQDAHNNALVLMRALPNAQAGRWWQLANAAQLLKLQSRACLAPHVPSCGAKSSAGRARKRHQ